MSSTDTVQSVPYQYEGLTAKTGGIRSRELITITAGSGIGKSLFCREIAYDLLVNKGWKVGYIALEENNARTLLGLMGIHVSRPLHISKDGVDTATLRGAFDAVSTGLSLYDSFGSVDPDNLIDRLRYLAVGLQCNALFLDHISIAISGLEDIDERRALDVMMTKLRSLVEETGVTMFVVSHLKRPSMGDKGHEQGLQTSLAQLRGSHTSKFHEGIQLEEVFLEIPFVLQTSPKTCIGSYFIQSIFTKNDTILVNRNQDFSNPAFLSL